MSIVPPFMDTIAARRSLYVELDKVMNWDSIAQLLLEVYPVGKQERGQKAYCLLLLLKMLLVGQWNKFSDRELKLYVWDTLSARRFCGLAIEDSDPDHSKISRFRTRLVSLGAWDGLLGAGNDQLCARGMKVTVCAIVDASLTESPYSPKGRGARSSPRIVRSAVRRTYEQRPLIMRPSNRRIRMRIMRHVWSRSAIRRSTCKFDIVVDFFAKIPYPLLSGGLKESCFELYFYVSAFFSVGRFALIRCVFRPSLSPIA